MQDQRPTHLATILLPPSEDTAFAITAHQYLDVLPVHPFRSSSITETVFEIDSMLPKEVKPLLFVVCEMSGCTLAYVHTVSERIAGTHRTYHVPNGGRS